MSNSGGSRVSIPKNDRQTVQTIKEVTKNHSDEDIYTLLLECSMDPNETIHRLLHLDTFHEVKKKRDKRKEPVQSRPAEESRGKPGFQGRGIRGARGNSYSQYSFNDAGGRGNAAFRKENGVGESRERGFRRSSLPASKDMDPIRPPHVEKLSPVTMNGPVKVPNGSLSRGYDSQSSGVHGSYLSVVNIGSSGNSSSMPKGSVNHTLSASDPVLVPSRDSRNPTAVGAIKREVRVLPISSESSESLLTNTRAGTVEFINGSHLSKHEPQNLDESVVSLPMIEKEAFEHVDVAQPKVPSQILASENTHLPDTVSAVKVSSPRGVEEATSKMEKLKFSDGKHVIIPDHIQVPDAVKNILSFGSLDASFGVRESYLDSEINQNSSPAVDSTHDETATQPPSCDQGVSTVPEGEDVDQADQPQSPSHVPGKVFTPEPKVPNFATVPKDDLPTEETLPAVGPPFPVVQTTPSYSFGYMPPLLMNQLVQSEGFESHAHMLNSQTGSPPVSTSSSTPPLTQSTGAGQSSVAVPPQPIALFRQPYPPNYVPFSYYPYYVHPTMHQYYGHTAFPQHLPPSNVYLPPPAAAPGMKISPPSYKPGVSVGNQAPIGLPSGYGAYTTSQVGFGHNASVTSGISSTNEDLVPSALKEHNVYPGQQTEGSPMWLSGNGRDTANFPLNSFINLPPQGHVIPPQTGPGAFVYHTLQPMAAPPPGLTLLQQSQPMAGPIESLGPPPSNAYQQPQRQQNNWHM